MEYRVKRTHGDQWNSDSVRALRAHLGLTQQQMSGAMGTRQQTINRMDLACQCPVRVEFHVDRDTAAQRVRDALSGGCEQEPKRQNEQECEFHRESREDRIE